MAQRERTMNFRRTKKAPIRISTKQIVAAISCSAIFLWTFVFTKITNQKQSNLFDYSTSVLLDREIARIPSVDVVTNINVGLKSNRERHIPPLTAYIEEPLQKVKPLPVRTKPRLTKITYDSIQSCRDLQNVWPVDHPIELDHRFGSNVGNNIFPMYPHRNEYSEFCPVDADPFLPWIHDVFTSWDGRFVEFVAHNKRKCRSQPSYQDDLTNLEPQVALMQSVSVKRLTRSESYSGSSSLDYPENGKGHRYRLATLQEADQDGRETRFICQFFKSYKTNDQWEKHVLGESLSVFPYNYEHDNFRKHYAHPMLTRPKDANDKHGAHNEQIWNTILHIRCPVPDELQETLQDGSSVVNDIPLIFIDLVPIRTHVRDDREGYNPYVESSSFNPKEEWGDNHILPTIEDSGRWSNIPVCRPPSPFDRTTNARKLEIVQPDPDNSRPHYLVGCLWASAAFTTRGVGSTIDESTPLRLLEWLTYHLYIAKFDHVYVYDNTEAFTNKTSLKPIMEHFPPHRVTWIPWKHRVCNNNVPAHPNAGERSSQYAAEASCRLRYGPYTEWIAQIDTDEYLIPAGNWTDIRSWLLESVKSGSIGKDTNILSFFQTRAIPNLEYMDPYADDSKECKAGAGREKEPCLAKKKDASFLQLYDCERTKLPKPDYGWRAMKQIYRPSFVWNHFVHYSTVTRRIVDAPNEKSALFIQRRPYERRTNELTEAFMIHTKTTHPSMTRNWKVLCKGTGEEERKKCPIGIPHNMSVQETGWPRTKDGLACNCFQHDRVQNEFVIKLQELLKTFSNPLKQSSLA